MAAVYAFIGTFGLLAKPFTKDAVVATYYEQRVVDHPGALGAMMLDAILLGVGCAILVEVGWLWCATGFLLGALNEVVALRLFMDYGARQAQPPTFDD